jgi:hypothetical protein
MKSEFTIHFISLNDIYYNIFAIQISGKNTLLLLSIEFLSMMNFRNHDYRLEGVEEVQSRWYFSNRIFFVYHESLF